MDKDFYFEESKQYFNGGYDPKHAAEKKKLEDLIKAQAVLQPLMNAYPGCQLVNPYMLANTTCHTSASSCYSYGTTVTVCATGGGGGGAGGSGVVYYCSDSEDGFISPNGKKINVQKFERAK
jgi:hypothetical protein